VEEGIVVHVAGAVVRPGIYRLPRGARVGEAVAAAGGFREEADTGAVNLARVLRDGEQVRIPERGRPSSGSDGGPLLDLNSASREELQKIPGIGPVLAERLVRYREEHGPFGSPDDLLQVPGIGPSKLREIKAFLGVP
jgi:competence protein ComEA